MAPRTSLACACIALSAAGSASAFALQPSMRPRHRIAPQASLFALQPSMRPRHRIAPQASLFEGLFQSPSAPKAVVGSKDRARLGDLSVSPIGVGTWSWGNQFLWGYSTEADAALQEVFDYVLVSERKG